MIQEVCQQLKAWQENPDVIEDIWVSVNLSNVQFKHHLFVKDICKVLLEVGQDANSLILELTEGGVMENPKAASRVLMQLRVTGARIALDDFGTGYSSLAHLCQFPLDYLKIDQSFVKNIETSKDAREIVKTISSLAHQLGLGVIAEGIENQRQLELISSLGCEYGQGFLFSEAVSKDKVESLLEKEFVPFKADTDLAMIPDEIETKHTPAIAESSILAVENPRSDPRKIGGKHRKFRTTGALSLAGSAAIILLLTVGLLDSFRTSTPTPSKELQVPSTAEIAPKPPFNTPNDAIKNKTAHVYKYPVVHDHFIGSCTGTLKVAHDTLSYVSENEDCSFNLAYAEIDISLDKDRLAIKSESKNYHFKSTDFATKEENQAQLQEILNHIPR